MPPRRLLLLALLPLACALFTPETPAMDTRPSDFSVRYDWYEGSLPPPYHYEYTLTIASDGSGTVTLVPDYPGEGVPEWTETFTLTPEALDALFAQVVEHGAFSTRWREVDDPPVGGSFYTVALTANGETVTIPSFVPENQAGAQDAISAAIRAAVPAEVWQTLDSQREQYVEENS